MPLNDPLAERARQVLRANDRGGYTIPTAGLYPFQWNWDASVCALGWMTFDEPRAWQEVETLFSGQWTERDFGGAAGALTKDGPGTMELQAESVYTGTTTVNAGTLQVDRALSTSSLIIGTTGGNAVSGPGFSVAIASLREANEAFFKDWMEG